MTVTYLLIYYQEKVVSLGVFLSLTPYQKYYLLKSNFMFNLAPDSLGAYSHTHTTSHSKNFCKTHNNIECL